MTRRGFLAAVMGAPLAAVAALRAKPPAPAHRFTEYKYLSVGMDVGSGQVDSIAVWDPANHELIDLRSYTPQEINRMLGPTLEEIAARGTGKIVRWGSGGSLALDVRRNARDVEAVTALQKT